MSVSRTIRFGATAPDPLPLFAWSGQANGASGYAVPAGFNAAGASFDTTTRELVLTRAAGTGSTRVVWPMHGLAIGQVYTLAIMMMVAGGSPAAGTQWSISTNANGASAIGIGNAASGTLSYQFIATAGTMYLVAQQPTAPGSDNVLRIVSLGPLEWVT